MSLKVLWITSHFPSNPTSDRSLYLYHPLQELVKLGVKPIVLNAQGWKPFVKEDINKTEFSIEINCRHYVSFPHHYFRAISNYFNLYRIVPEIKKLHKRHTFDIIHAHGEINGLSAMVAAEQLKIPSVVTIHGIDTCKRMWKGAAGKMFSRMFNGINRVIYVGEPLQQHFRYMMEDDAHCRILHNGFRLPFTPGTEVLNHASGDRKTIHIISVSNLHEGKGIDITLKALLKLERQGIKNWTYTIVGSGNQKPYLERIVNEEDLSAKVKFLGNCSHEEVYGHLKMADIFCLPSYREAFGIAYVEAMAHGLLTIGVKGQGPSAFIDHGRTGFVVEPKNIDDLAEKLHFAVTAYGEMQGIAQAGKQHVLKNFTWKNHAEKLVGIYEEVMNESA